MFDSCDRRHNCAPYRPMQPACSSECPADVGQCGQWEQRWCREEYGVVHITLPSELVTQRQSARRTLKSVQRAVRGTSNTQHYAATIGRTLAAPAAQLGMCSPRSSQHQSNTPSDHSPRSLTHLTPGTHHRIRHSSLSHNTALPLFHLPSIVAVYYIGAPCRTLHLSVAHPISGLPVEWLLRTAGAFDHTGKRVQLTHISLPHPFSSL